MLGRMCRGFCESYDMHQHSTKVVRDIVSGLAAFIQSQFISQSSLSQSSSGMLFLLLLRIADVAVILMKRIFE